jgi:uncharacterized membrane protein (DUF4010 family)
VLIAALGFGNYILLNLYGARGIELTGFLGGLVNSAVTITELATRARKGSEQIVEAAYRGTVLATAAMLLRNGVLLGLLAPRAFVSALAPLALMLAGALGAVAWDRRRRPHLGTGGASGKSDAPAIPAVMSPFSLSAALKFGLIFLTLQVATTLAERYLGAGGLYVVSVAGGVVSSASTVASAANLATAGSLSARVAAHSAIIASIASALVDLPLVSRFGRNARLTRRTAVLIGSVALLGAIGVAADLFLF